MNMVKFILWSLVVVVVVNTAWFAVSKFVGWDDSPSVKPAVVQGGKNGTSTLKIGEESRMDDSGFLKIPKGQTLIPDLDRGSLPLPLYTVPSVLHPNGLNIVFVADNFATYEEFLTAVKFLKDGLVSIEPWQSYRDFNFFIVFPGKERACSVQTENLRRPALRCTTRINDLINPLGLYRFKAVIVSRDEFTAWANVTRLENSVVALYMPASGEGQVLQRKIFLHELAHGFGLRDEMTKSVIAQAGSEGTMAEGPNCAPDIKTAISWWGDLVKRSGDRYVFEDDKNDIGFYFGCAGSETNIKPMLGSLMNLQDNTYPSEDYGPVSTRYLKKVLDYCFSQKRHKASDDPAFFELYPDFSPCVN